MKIWLFVCLCVTVCTCIIMCLYVCVCLSVNRLALSCLSVSVLVYFCMQWWRKYWIQCTYICSAFSRWLVLSQMEYWRTQMCQPFTHKSVRQLPLANRTFKTKMADQAPCFLCKCKFFAVFSLRFFKSYREIDTVQSDNKVLLASNNGWPIMVR